MDFNQFLRDRQHRWQRLALLLDRVEAVRLSGLTHAEADELFSLYRLVSSDLNLVQTRTGNPALLDYLEKLIGRAYANLSVPRRANLLRSWWTIVRHNFPAAVRAEWRMLLLACLAMLSGALFAFITTWFNPNLAEIYLPAEHLDQTPSERVAMLEEMEREGRTRVDDAGDHTLFSTFLFTHNIRVSVLCFALGFTFGLGTLVLLFMNGALLGSIAARYFADGVGLFFVAWVGPHGSIELPCVMFAGAAGFMIARTQFRRNHGPMGVQFREIRPRLVEFLVGSATLLVLAGIVEGGFSQINEPTLPYVLKVVVAAGLFVALLAYLFIMPVSPQRTEDANQLAVVVG